MSVTNNHHQMVAGLAKPGLTILKQTTSELAHIIHMTMGLIGEAVEVQNHFVEPPESEDPTSDLLYELGDIMFYLVGLLQSQSMKLHELILESQAPTGTVDQYFTKLQQDADNLGCEVEELMPAELVRWAGKVSEAFKKHWIYGKPLPTNNLKTWFLCIVALVDGLAVDNGSSLIDVLQMNIDKLGARYKNFDYSDEAAIRQDDAKKV